MPVLVSTTETDIKNHHQCKHVLCILDLNTGTRFMDTKNRIQETIININMYCVYLILKWVQDFIDTRNRIQETIINATCTVSTCDLKMGTTFYGYKKQNSRNHHQCKHVLCILILIWVQDFMDIKTKFKKPSSM